MEEELKRSNNVGNNVMVSIKCCVYNHSRFLRQCLEGFVMQKTNFKFEAIIHDDASTDNSADIIREYEKKYPEIIKPIYEKENVFSRHDGSLVSIMTQACSGKYIATCEGDDYWTDPFKLQRQVDYMESHPGCSLCFHNAVVVFSDTDRAPYLFNSFEKNRNVTMNELLDNWIVPTASMLLRREIFDTYPEWTRDVYSGDMTLQLLSCSLGEVYGMKEVMSCYRKTYHTESSTSQFESKALYVHEQHIKLLNLFNEHTSFKYDNELKKYIREKEDIIKYAHLRKRNFLLAQIMMPKFFIKRLKEKFVCGK